MLAGRARSLKFLLATAVLFNAAVWLYARDIKGRWTNVPPVPTLAGAASIGLGDGEFSYRAIGIMLQNLGDTGGRTTKFDDYDYPRLTQWFMLEDRLDPHSDFVPYLASFYFGSVQTPDKIRALMPYLRQAGDRPEGQKWRWLAQAVYLARFVLNDQDLALELAEKLSAIDNPHLPHWARQMPAFVMTARGSKEEAVSFLAQMLKDNAHKMTPKEVNFTLEYICTRILDAQEAAVHPLCKDRETQGNAAP